MRCHVLLWSVLGLTGCFDVSCELTGDCALPEEAPWDPSGGGAEDGSGYGYGTSPVGGLDEEEGFEEEIEIVAQRSCTSVIRHPPEPGVSTIAVSGEFNDWTPQALTGPDADGLLSVEIPGLAAGEYAYKFVYDGNYEDAPPPNVYSKWTGTSENRNLRVGDCQRPLLQAVSSNARADGSLTATFQFASAADGSPVDPSGVRVTVGSQVVTPVVDAASGRIQVSASGLAPGKHSVRVWAEDAAGRTAENEPLFLPLWVEDEPFVWDDAMLYFVFTDRFRNGDWGDEPYGPTSGAPTCSNYQGGDFQGVIDALEEDYFTSLGIDTLWLSPVYDNPEGGWIGINGIHNYSGYHGYWPLDPLEIEDRWGDATTSGADKLHELIELAHSKGIRVMFDLVLNHVHQDHTYTREHPEWFGGGCVCGEPGCGWDEKPIECWFVSYLPDLDYKNHEITKRVLDDTLRLVELYDVDAVRVDAAKHMDHVIMRSLRKRLEEDFGGGGGAPFYMVGETFDFNPYALTPYISDNELHGQFDFPTYSAVRQAFIHGGSFRDLDNTAAELASIYGDALMSPFLGNHDIPRFATEFTGAAGDCWSEWLDDPVRDGGEVINQWDLINRMSMAFAYTLTQPGVPLLYYGDEIGLHGAGDPDNRRMMSFAPYLSANQSEILSRVQAIGQARRASPALKHGARRSLWVSDDLLVYALDAGNGDVALVALNRGSETSPTVSLSGLGVTGASFTDRISGDTFSASGDDLVLPLGNWQYRVLTR